TGAFGNPAGRCRNACSASPIRSSGNVWANSGVGSRSPDATASTASARPQTLVARHARRLRVLEPVPALPDRRVRAAHPTAFDADEHFAGAGLGAGEPRQADTARGRDDRRCHLASIAAHAHSLAATFGEGE